MHKSLLSGLNKPTSSLLVWSFVCRTRKHYSKALPCSCPRTKSIPNFLRVPFSLEIWCSPTVDAHLHPLNRLLFIGRMRVPSSLCINWDTSCSVQVGNASGTSHLKGKLEALVILPALNAIEKNTDAEDVSTWRPLLFNLICCSLSNCLHCMVWWQALYVRKWTVISVLEEQVLLLH